MSTPADLLANIGDTFPGRDRHGYVVGYYVTSGYGTSQTRAGGPFPTLPQAEDAAAKTYEAQIVAGLVFTPSGTVVRDQSRTARARPYD